MKQLTDSYLADTRKVSGYIKILQQGEQSEVSGQQLLNSYVCNRKIKRVQTLLERRGISDRFTVVALSTTNSGVKRNIQIEISNCN